MERNTIDLVVTEETHKNDASSFVRVVHTGENLDDEKWSGFSRQI